MAAIRGEGRRVLGKECGCGRVDLNYCSSVRTHQTKGVDFGGCSANGRANDGEGEGGNREKECVGVGVC